MVLLWGFPYVSAGKESAYVGDLGSIPGWGRSPGEGKGYPLQYPGLENSMDCTVHGVTKSRTRLSDCHFHFVVSKTHVGWYLLPSWQRLSIRLLERQDTCAPVTLKSPGSLNLPVNICDPYGAPPASFSFLIFTFNVCSS